MNVNDAQRNQLKELYEMECSVLSDVLANKKDTVEKIFLRLEDSDFNDPINSYIYSKLKLLHDSHKAFDASTLINFLASNKYDGYDEVKVTEQIEYIRGKRFWNLPSLHYVEDIKNFSNVKKLKNLIPKIDNIQPDTINLEQKIVDLEKEFIEITSAKRSSDILSIDQVIDGLKEKLRYHEENKDRTSKFGTGYDEIDYYTGGFSPGEFIVLAARPGMGKTTLAINFSILIAERLKEENEKAYEAIYQLEDEDKTKALSNFKESCVVFFSLEMDKEEIAAKFLNIIGGYNFDLRNFSDWTDWSKNMFYEASLKVKGCPIFIDDSADLTLVDIQAKIQDFQKKYDVKLVVIDYLQLLRYEKNRRPQNRQEEVSLISRNLKLCAKKFNIPILSLAQLSREIEKRKGDNKKPLLSDLRESGAIEQDADMVMFISDPVGDDKEETEFQIVLPNQIEQANNLQATISQVDLVLAKNRHGPTGKIKFAFEKHKSQFTLWSKLKH